MRPPPVELERVRDLLSWWEARQGAAGPALDAMLAAMLAQLDGDRHLYGDVFEPSFSWDPDGCSFRRFSYAFPGFRAAPDAVAAALRAMTAPWGGVVVEACERLLRAARHPAVAQPLVGFADDGARGRRIKLYLQFRDDAAGAAPELAQAITGARIDLARLGGALHMCGLDFSERGLRAAKLYVAPTRPAERTWFGLALSNLLEIRHIDDPSQGVPDAPSEIDFPLPENGLDPRDLWAAPAIRDRLAPAIARLAELAAAFPLRIRRVSCGVARPKLNVYYVTAE
jgi:hypothetical protein